MSRQGSWDTHSLPPITPGTNRHCLTTANSPKCVGITLPKGCFLFALIKLLQGVSVLPILVAAPGVGDRKSLASIISRLQRFRKRGPHVPGHKQTVKMTRRAERDWPSSAAPARPGVTGNRAPRTSAHAGAHHGSGNTHGRYRGVHTRASLTQTSLTSREARQNRLVESESCKHFFNKTGQKQTTPRRNRQVRAAHLTHGRAEALRGHEPDSPGPCAPHALRVPPRSPPPH